MTFKIGLKRSVKKYRRLGDTKLAVRTLMEDGKINEKSWEIWNRLAKSSVIVARDLKLQVEWR